MTTTPKVTPKKPKAKPLTEIAAEMAGELKEKITAAKAFLEVFPVVCPILIKHEGVHDDDPSTPQLEPTPDPAGWYTLGYGHLIIDPSTGSRIPRSAAGHRRVTELYPDGITLEDARALLQADCYVRFLQLYARPSYQKLPVHQQAALLSFAYNIGVHGLFKSTAWRLILEGKPGEEMADPAGLWEHMVTRGPLSSLDRAFTAWSRQTSSQGIRTPSYGLFFRRLAEYLVFQGVDPDDANEQSRLVTKAAAQK